MTTRRNLLIGAASLAVLGAARARAEPILTDDGLYKEPWFLESFLELADDLEGAHKEGKRFVIMWELKGCPYCKETHFVNFAQSRHRRLHQGEFRGAATQHHRLAQGDRFRRHGTVGKGAGREIWRALHADLPVFPGTGRPAEGAGAAKREVARAPGYMRPDDFLAMFRYVREKAYESKSFRDFVKSLPS